MTAERDAMTLLREANPIQLEDVPDVGQSHEARALLNSIVAGTSSGGTLVRRRTLVAIATAGAAAAVALIGVFVFTGQGPRPSAERLRAQPDTETFAYPLGRGAKQTTLADASTTLGAPLVLPNSPLVKASDAGPVWTDTDSHGTRRVAVTFPSQSLTIKYERPVPFSDPLANYQQYAKSTPETAQVIDLSGVPALAVKMQSGGSDWTHGGWIQFVAGGTAVVVQGHYDESTLQDVAQSIVPQVGSKHRGT
jgi:hypothetical protein